MDEAKIALAMPIIEKYNIVLKCKNLGISVNADSLTPEELDLIHDFYSELETVRANKKGG